MSDAMTADELAAIREREKKATKGPWARKHDRIVSTGRERHAFFGGMEPTPVMRPASKEPGYALPGEVGRIDCTVGEFNQEADNADFIAAAREDVPRLLGEVERLKRHAEHWERGDFENQKRAESAEATLAEVTRERDAAVMMLNAVSPNRPNPEVELLKAASADKDARIALVARNVEEARAVLTLGGDPETMRKRALMFLDAALIQGMNPPALAPKPTKEEGEHADFCDDDTCYGCKDRPPGPDAKPGRGGET